MARGYDIAKAFSQSVHIVGFSTGGLLALHHAAMHPQAGTWSYGYMTMLILLAPAVMDSIGGASASVKFWDRIIMFAGATLYAVAAVYIVDAFRPRSAKK